MASPVEYSRYGSNKHYQYDDEEKNYSDPSDEPVPAAAPEPMSLAQLEGLGHFNEAQNTQNIRIKMEFLQFQFLTQEKPAYIQQGNHLIGQRKYREAIGSFNHVLQRVPKDPEATKGMREACVSQGDLCMADGQYLTALSMYLKAESAPRVEDSLIALNDEAKAYEAVVEEDWKRGTLEGMQHAYEMLIYADLNLDHALKMIPAGYHAKDLPETRKRIQEKLSFARQNIQKMEPTLARVGKQWGDGVKNKEDLLAIYAQLREFLKKGHLLPFQKEAERLYDEIYRPVKSFLLADRKKKLDDLLDEIQLYSWHKAGDMPKIIRVCEQWVECFGQIFPKDRGKILTEMDEIITAIHWQADQYRVRIEGAHNFVINATKQAVKELRRSAEVPLRLEEMFGVAYKEMFEKDLVLQTKYMNLSEQGMNEFAGKIKEKVKSQIPQGSYFFRCCVGHRIQRKLNRLVLINAADLHRYLDEIGPSYEIPDIKKRFAPKEQDLKPVSRTSSRIDQVDF